MRYSVKVHTFPNRDTNCDCITNECGSGTNMKKVKRQKTKRDLLDFLGPKPKKRVDCSNAIPYK